MISFVLLITACLLFACGLFLKSRHEGIATRLLLSAIIFFVASAYILFVSLYYKNVATSSGKLRVTDCEAEYFAIQTFTTVGYGKALCELPKDLDTLPLTYDEKCKFCDKFQTMASWTMIFWPVNWLVIITMAFGAFQNIVKKQTTTG